MEKLDGLNSFGKIPDMKSRNRTRDRRNPCCRAGLLANVVNYEVPQKQENLKDQKRFGRGFWPALEGCADRKLDMVPLVLSTSEAARYIAGISILDKNPVSTKCFLKFAKQHGLRPASESKTVCERRGETFVYHKRCWSRRQIDAALG